MRNLYNPAKMRNKSRKTRMPRFPFCNSIKANRIVPLNYQHVNPGETLTSLKTQGRMISEPVSRIMTPAYCDFYTFYVPYRLVSEGFVELLLSSINEQGNTAELDVTGPDSATTQSATQGSEALTAGQYAGMLAQTYFYKFPDANNRPNPYFGKAMAAIYNEWFNNEDPVDFNFTSADPLPRLPHVDELAEFVALGELPNVPMPDNIADLEQAQRLYEHQLRTVSTNDSYTGYLQQFGIPSERGLLEAPELITKRRHFIYPSRTVGFSDANIVGQYQYDFEINIKNKPKMFEEHGLLINFMALRPEVFINKAGPLDSYRGTHDEFSTPLSDDIRVTLDAAEWTRDPGGDEVSLNQLAHLGEHFVGDMYAPGVGARPPVLVGGVDQLDETNLWDLPNFQYTTGTDAEKLNKVAWVTGITSTSIKSHVMNVPHAKTRANSRR